MKIAVLEKVSLGNDIDISFYQDFGEVIYYDNTTATEVASRVADVDIIIANKAPRNAETLAGAKNLKIICETATGYNNVDYANAMVALAEYRNDPRVTCINASDKDATGVNMNDASFRSKYCIKPDDVSHLNEAGMAYILPFFEKQIAEKYSAFLKTKNT